MAPQDIPGIESIFRQRERQALKVLVWVRIVWLLGGWIVANIAAHSQWERDMFNMVIPALLASFAIAMALRNYFNNYRFAGLAYILFDLLLVIVVALIWRESVGGADEGIPVYFPFKSTLFGFMMVLIVMNGLALQPVYVIVETVEMIIVAMGFYVWALMEQTGHIGGSYITHALGPDLYPGAWFGMIGLVAGTGMLTALIAWTARRAIYDVSVKERTTKEMGRYLSPNLARLLEENPEGMQLDGARRELSFVFTDLAGFTRFVDQTDPETAVHIINLYLDGMTRIALDHGGTVDKVVGDALHIFFNAPEDQPDHASRAITCALALDDFARAFYFNQQGKGREFGKTRIGVHMGEVTVGNFGGEILFDYTAHGQAINVTARLEEACKDMGCSLLVSRAVADAAGWQDGTSLGMVDARGTGQQVEVLGRCVLDR